MAGSILPPNKKLAQSIGAVRYFTGIPCRNSHTDERYACDGQCCECVREKLRRRDKSVVARKAAERRARNPLAAKAAKLKYREANYERYRALENKRRRDQYKTDPAYKGACLARSMLQRVLAMSKKKKNTKTFEAVGYTCEQFVAHIEKQFTNGMSWSLIGKGVEIDHIIPIIHFIKNGVTEVSVINALSNLRPIMSIENRKKRDKLIFLI